MKRSDDMVERGEYCLHQSKVALFARHFDRAFFTPVHQVKLLFMPICHFLRGFFNILYAGYAVLNTLFCCMIENPVRDTAKSGLRAILNHLYSALIDASNALITLTEVLFRSVLTLFTGYDKTEKFSSNKYSAELDADLQLDNASKFQFTPPPDYCFTF